MNIKEILAQMCLSEQAEATPFKSAEDGTDYAVWKINDGNTAYVLKQASEQELSVYNTFLASAERAVPHLYKSLNYCGELFLLMEYIEGHDLRKCDRESLTAVLDALIYLQNMYWERRECQAAGLSFEASLPRQQNRGKYLNDADLEHAYAEYLKLYSIVPRTLCHDDLLPFNVLCANGHATIIDWEYAAILPYPTSLARLIAHGEEDESAFFYMTQADKDYAIEYYFEHLLKENGIDYNDYRRTLDYFLLYEYCELIMLGAKYNETDSERFQKYYAKAKEHIKSLA